MFNPENRQWKQGPRMKEKREEHSCFYDNHSNSIFVVGGRNESNYTFPAPTTTEQLNLDTKEWKSAPSLPEPTLGSAGVASKSIDYVGFVTGGYVGPQYVDWERANKVYGLRRKDLNWEVMPQQLESLRVSHSMVNVAYHEVPGCGRNFNSKTRFFD